MCCKFKSCKHEFNISLDLRNDSIFYDESNTKHCLYLFYMNIYFYKVM